MRVAPSFVKRETHEKANMLNHLCRRGRLKTLALAALAFVGFADHASADDFYKGKTISIVISGAGTFDTWARLISRFMSQHIPGEPVMVVKSMQGAAGLKAANYMYNLAPKDGTEIAGLHGQVPTLPLFNREGVQYDPTKFEWLGNVTRGLYIAYAWNTSPVQSMEDLLHKEMIVGGQSVGAIPVDVSIFANVMIGTKLKIVTGYPGAADSKLAVLRGELNGEFGTLLTTIRSSNPEWFSQKLIKVIAQFGTTRHKDLPDAPLLLDYVKDPADRAALDLYLSRQATDKPYLAPPGVPAERLAILRAAFDATVRDSGFIAEAAKLGLDVDSPLTGQQVADFVERATRTPPSAAKRISDILNSYSNR